MVKAIGGNGNMNFHAQDFHISASAKSSDLGGIKVSRVNPSSELPALTRSYAARGTGYYPDSSPMEGGFTDRKGNPLHTLQDYLAGRAPFVSVAMDANAFPYGTHLRIPELEQKYGQQIDFRVVDTGSAFKNKGTSRIDICTANRRASLDPTINGPLHLVLGSQPPSAKGSSSSEPTQPSQAIPMLHEGSRGAEVRTMQQQLAKLGFNPGPVDGIFGPHTRAALRAFQRRSRLSPDGVFGPKSNAALVRASNVDPSTGISHNAKKA